MKNKQLIWPFGFYFLIFGGLAAYRPYLVLYYQSLSFSGAQIGLLTGIAPLLTLVSLPLISSAADRTNRHKGIMSLALLVMVGVLIFYPQLNSFLLLLSMAVLTAVAYSPILSLANNATMFMLGERKELYGRIRLGGTIGFSVIAALAGLLVEQYGLKIAFWSAAVLFFIAFGVNQQLTHSEATDEEPAAKGRASELLKKPHFLLFLLISFSGGISFATLNAYLFPYMKTLGAGESLMGIALTIGTIGELPVLFFANRFVKRFGAYPLLILSLAMTGLRFLLLGVAPTPTFVLLIQLLNGLNYPLLMVAGVTYADAHAPQGLRATAQGLFNVAYGGIGSAIGGFVGGLLFESLGARGMYLAFAAFVAVVLVVVSAIKRSLPAETNRLATMQQ
ncbi:MAG: MFS transporter [Ardenticatenaceae bacterium]|nr:MFS transporter [Ardenticatenaceae bacterium]